MGDIAFVEEDQAVLEQRRSDWLAAKTAQANDEPRRALEEDRTIKTLAIWLAGKQGLTEKQTFDELKVIYRSLEP